MTDYISREAAISSIAHEDASFIYAIERVPAADVRPVVRGKWVQDCDYHFRCSVCGDRRIVSNGNPLDVANGWNFCPNCGADLKGGQKR